MICDPVLIVGAPRSGTSLLQKILRNHTAFWSLPSESEMVWDKYCHPRLRNWDSECVDEAAMTPRIREDLRRDFENHMWPARVWGPIERTNLIWGFRRRPLIQAAMKNIYRLASPPLRGLFSRHRTKRFVEKTVSNCLRLGFVDEVFPDARIVYVVRDGRNSVNSLINSWLHPTRFFTYDVPERLDMRGYPHGRWKFVLPPGWRRYVRRPLEEVCAFQWQSCNDAVLAEIAKPRYAGRVLRLRIEDVAACPADWLCRLAEFVGLRYDDYFRGLADDLPVVNSADNDTSREKWRYQNRDMVERVVSTIQPTMWRLGYEVPT